MPLRSGRGTAGVPFHVVNRAARRLELFESDADYRAFLFCLVGSLERVNVRLLSYCLMPNHFHLVAMPVIDGQLSSFMKHLLSTHGQRWRSFRKTTGEGAVYQGRFRAFPIQTDEHFYAVCRYVERNALRAGLVARAEDWPWCSLSQATGGASPVPLAEWPIPRPLDWLERVNADQPPKELEVLRLSTKTERPFGGQEWSGAIAATQGVAHKLRGRGRPEKKTSGGFSTEKASRRLFEDLF